MQRVKSLRKGWVFGWQGTRNGQIYQLPGNSDTGFFKFIDPFRPTPENCPCMRQTPAKLPQEPKPKVIRRPNTGTKTGPKVSQIKPKKTVFGDTVVDSIQIDARELTRQVPHAKIFSHKSETTSPDPVRTKAANKKRAAAERRVEQAKKLKKESKERKRFLHQTARKKPQGATKQPPLPSQKKEKKVCKRNEQKESSIQPSPISEEVMEKVKMRIIELEEQAAENRIKELLSAENKEQTGKKAQKTKIPQTKPKKVVLGNSSKAKAAKKKRSAALRRVKQAQKLKLES